MFCYFDKNSKIKLTIPNRQVSLSMPLCMFHQFMLTFSINFGYFYYPYFLIISFFGMHPFQGFVIFSITIYMLCLYSFYSLFFIFHLFITMFMVFLLSVTTNNFYIEVSR
jgi:hypothetical protein